MNNISHNKSKWFLGSLLALASTGCMVGPDYVPPKEFVPDEWVETPIENNQNTNEPVSITDDTPETEWWKIFNDCLLDNYISTAAAYNNSIKIAEANIQQARAMQWVAASALFPQVFADANASRTSFSQNGPLFALQSPSATGGTVTGKPVPNNPGTGGGTPIAPGFQVIPQLPRIQNLFNATFDATWELDIFGKTRRNIEAAEANYEGYIAQRNQVLISILAEVARNYVELRSFQKRELLTLQNIELLKNEAKIIQNRFQAGLGNSLDVERIDAEILKAQAALPNLKAEIYKRIYALSVLTGRLPEALLEELLPPETLPRAPDAIAVGLRSDLLRRRPDVQQAERQLAAATANIGVAVASFFPSISLNGFEGFQSIKLGNLFSPKSFTWSVGGDINLPVFQGGRLVGNLRVNEAAAVAAGYNYQQVVLNAIQEAEGSLISYLQEKKTSSLLEGNVSQNQRIVDTTNRRYVGGLVNMTDLLDSNRQLITSQLNLLDSETAALVDLIAVYKALGGGWELFSYCLPQMLP